MFQRPPHLALISCRGLHLRRRREEIRVGNELGDGVRQRPRIPASNRKQAVVGGRIQPLNETQQPQDVRDSSIANGYHGSRKEEHNASRRLGLANATSKVLH
jgi:hypothetical protein